MCVLSDIHIYGSQRSMIFPYGYCSVTFIFLFLSYFFSFFYGCVNSVCCILIYVCAEARGGHFLNFLLSFLYHSAFVSLRKALSHWTCGSDFFVCFFVCLFDFVLFCFVFGWTDIQQAPAIILSLTSSVYRTITTFICVLVDLVVQQWVLLTALNLLYYFLK